MLLPRPDKLEAEYWFTGVKLIPADGDDNHIAVFARHVSDLVCKEINDPGLRELLTQWCDDAIGLRCSLAEWYDAWAQSHRVRPDDLTCAEILRRFGATQPEDVLRCLVESDPDRFDSREVAIRAFKWVRVRGSNLLVYRVDAEQLRAVARELEYVLFVCAGGEVDLGPAAEPTFTLEVRDPQRTFYNVPLSVLLAGDVSRLPYYGRCSAYPAVLKAADITGG